MSTELPTLTSVTLRVATGHGVVDGISHDLRVEDFVELEKLR